MRRAEIWLMGTVFTLTIALWRGGVWLNAGAQPFGTMVLMGMIVIDGLLITGFVASMWAPVMRVRAFRRQRSEQQRAQAARETRIR